MVKNFIVENINEALDIREKYNAIPFAGGTDLMVEYLRGSNLLVRFERPVLFLQNIDSIRGINEEDDNIIIGATTTFNEIIESDIIPVIIKESALGIAGPPIRNIATIGGNICNASPSADSLPVLYAMDAILRLKSKNSQRDVKIKDFITGVGKTIIKYDEILTHIIIKKQTYHSSFYKKIGTRKANALSKLASCFLVLKENSNYKFIISFCTLGTTITRDEKIENKFITSEVKNWVDNIEDIKKEYSLIMNPRDSARSTALYRKKTALNLIEYFINKTL